MRSRLTAIIELGSSGIRLLVAEIHTNGTWSVLDRAGRPIALGRDVFTGGSISRDLFLECLEGLRNFKELLESWRIDMHDVHVIATSALREARNRDNFIDRVRIKTGFVINVVEGIEENRLMYLAVRWALKEEGQRIGRTNSVILEVGGGSTEMMLLRRGKMVAAHSLRIGTLLADQQLHQHGNTMHYLHRYLKEQIQTTCETLNTELKLSNVRNFIIAGADARLAASRLGFEINDSCQVIDRTAFIDFVEKIREYSLEDCVHELHIPYAEAEGLVAGLLAYRYFLEKTSAERIIVPNISIREGLLINLASDEESTLQEEFFSQVIASAVSLGRKFHYDETHAQHVTLLSLKLFDLLQDEHGLDRRSRLLLEVAAILHDIGMFVRSSGHHKHSQYIVANSEIFALHRDDIDIISNVVRYHRKNKPNNTHISYIALQKEDRMLVLKLAAILRLADAMDRGHSQRIVDFEIERGRDFMLINTGTRKDHTLERMAIEEKGDMFEDVFGYKVQLI